MPELTAEENERIMAEPLSPKLLAWLTAQVNSLRCVDAAREPDYDGGACDYGFSIRTNGGGIWSIEGWSMDSSVWRSEFRGSSLEGALDEEARLGEATYGEGPGYKEWPSLEVEEW